MKHWQIIAENLSLAGFSWGCSSETDSTGRVLYMAEAFSKGGGRRFIVLADEKLSAFLELERVTRESLRFCSVRPASTKQKRFTISRHASSRGDVDSSLLPVQRR
jgi:hypothetical protein